MHRALAAAAAAILALPASAAAAETTISVGNDFFKPADVQITVGDTVNWVFSEAGNHNIRSRPNQAESFNSDPGVPLSAVFHPAGYKFSHTFTKDNVAVDYLCEIHPSTMKGTVTVGAPPVDAQAPALIGAGARVQGRKVSVSFKIDEAARVTLKLSKASKPKRTLRTVRRSVEAGKRSMDLRRRGLEYGRYVVRLSAQDEAGNTSDVKKAAFRLTRPRRAG